MPTLSVKLAGYTGTVIGGQVGSEHCCGSGASFTPGSGIGFFRIPDLGTQIHIFDSFVTIDKKGKNYNNSL
jgi:hypothetical protein